VMRVVKETDVLNKKIDWNCSLSIDLFAEVQIGAD
jgi:hypothetical protein